MTSTHARLTAALLPLVGAAAHAAFIGGETFSASYSAYSASGSLRASGVNDSFTVPPGQPAATFPNGPSQLNGGAVAFSVTETQIGLVDYVYTFEWTIAGTSFVDPLDDVQGAVIDALLFEVGAPAPLGSGDAVTLDTTETISFLDPVSAAFPAYREGRFELFDDAGADVLAGEGRWFISPEGPHGFSAFGFQGNRGPLGGFNLQRARGTVRLSIPAPSSLLPIAAAASLAATRRRRTRDAG